MSFQPWAVLTQGRCQTTVAGQMITPAPGTLDDGEVSLVLAVFEPAAASMWHTPTYRFEVRRGGGRVGHLNLRVGDERRVRFVGHVGYGVDEPFRGRGIAGRAVRLVLPLAAACGIDPVWVTCGPDNPASRRTLERLGAELVEIVDVPEDYPVPAGAVRQKCRFRLQGIGSGGTHGGAVGLGGV